MFYVFTPKTSISILLQNQERYSSFFGSAAWSGLKRFSTVISSLKFASREAFWLCSHLSYELGNRYTSDSYTSPPPKISREGSSVRLGAHAHRTSSPSTAKVRPACQVWTAGADFGPVRTKLATPAQPYPDRRETRATYRHCPARRYPRFRQEVPCSQPTSRRSCQLTCGRSTVRPASAVSILAAILSFPPSGSL